MLIDKLGGSLPSPEKLSATMSTGFFFFGPRNQWRGFRGLSLGVANPPHPPSVGAFLHSAGTARAQRQLLR